MLKKIPQDENIKRGDIVFYKDIFGYEEYPMVVLRGSIDLEIRVRYYYPYNDKHHIIKIKTSCFIKM